MMLLGVAGRSNEAKKVKKIFTTTATIMISIFYQTLSPIHLPQQSGDFF
jgi:hypothetical protein